MDRKILDLEKKARWVRRKILEMVISAKKGHIGGAFSCVDILVALYYGGILHFDPKNSQWMDRDRFVMSKGHSSMALYAILADLGFFPVSELETFGKNGTALGGHPDIHISGVEANTGSLGQGLGIAAGMALAAKRNSTGHLCYVLLGDGECYEGSVLEAAVFAANHKLDNLIAIVDRNFQCVTDFTEDCVRLEPFADKWIACGWDVKEINGISLHELMAVLNTLKEKKTGRPFAIIAKTIKGKGVSFMEGCIKWHHCIPVGDQIDRAIAELVKEGSD